MRFALALLFPCLLLFSQTLPAVAQEYEGEIASCDMCLPSSVPRGPLEVLFEPGWQVGVDHQYTPLKNLNLNGHEIANPDGEKILSNTTHLNFTYNVTEKSGFIISIPFHHKDYQRRVGDEIQRGTVSGLGDLVLRARFSPVARFSEKRTLVWTVEAGLKLPTGDSSMLRDHGHSHGVEATPSGGSQPGHHQHDGSEGENHHHGRAYLAHEGHDHGDGGGEEEQPQHAPSEASTAPGATHSHHHLSAVEGHDLTLGSGSVDGILGTGLVYQDGNVYATAGAQYLLRSQGTAGYRYGDMLTWRVAPGYLFIHEDNRILGLQVNVSGEHHDPNRVYNLKDHGYVDIIYAGPEVVAQGENLSLGLGLDLPVKYRAEGRTLAPDYRARFHFNWRF
jgi:hypothetical protein